MPGMDRLILFGGSFVLDGSDFDRAPQHPDATQVGVADLFEVVETKFLKERESVVIRVVVVPLESFGMVENNVSRQGIVTIDDIATSLLSGNFWTLGRRGCAYVK